MAQQELAHSLIEAGADLIIGSHPHVVQDIEKYQGRLIFYSLGNFVFDQSFSRETSQGLALSLELYSDRAVFNLLPAAVEQGQPFLMAHDQSEQFLNELAALSEDSLSKEIKRARIVVDFVF